MLRFEIRVHHADALLHAEIAQHRALAPLPIGEMLVVEDDHAALRRDVRPFRTDARQQARIAVVPCVADERLDRLREGHGHCPARV